MPALHQSQRRRTEPALSEVEGSVRPTQEEDNAMTPNSDPKRELLRHTVATLAYRGGKAIRNAPPGFAEFRASESGRTPGQILAHLGDLFDWALSIVQNKQTWKNSEP